MALVPYDRATFTEVLATNRCRPGTVATMTVLKERTESHIGRHKAKDGCYNRRPIRGSSTAWSTHAVGRGIDLGITLDNQGLQLGNFLFLTLLDPSNAVPLSIQCIIWNYAICKPGESPQPYKPGSDPTTGHRDHLHIELNRWGAERNTLEWVRGVI